MTMYRPHRLCPKENKPKEPSLYRSLCISILSMLLSTVMLVGTTMAWFSDSLQTGMYTITSANFSTTVYYCTDLSSTNGTPNNWQRLNPGNTTLFGGGSLSSGGSQVAYLKLVNNSDMPLKYTFTLTASEGGSSIDLLSLAGCWSTKNSESSDVALTESDLKGIEPSTVTPDVQNSKEVTFEVPAADTNSPSIVYAILKLTYTGSSAEKPESNIYNFSLKLAIKQTDPKAQAAEPESPVTTTVDMTVIDGTPSNPNTTASDDTNSGDDGTPTVQPSGDTNNTEPSSGSAGEAGNNTETSGSGTPDTNGDTNGDTTVPESGTVTEPTT